MAGGNVLFAHSNAMLVSSVERLVTSENPRVHTECASGGKDALTIQSVMRADVIVLSMNQPDMTGEHLIHELKSDIARPFIIVLGKEIDAQARRRIRRMGADEVMGEEKVIDTGRMIKEQLNRREQETRGALPEATLQRLFADRGIPFDLKGYQYMKYALMLLGNGEAQIEPIQSLYKRIGEKYGCKPSSVERNIRYAVGLCGDKGEKSEKIGNRKFIANLMEQGLSDIHTMYSPRISVFASGRRLFR